MESGSARMAERLEAVRLAVRDQARAVDENLRTILLLMTTDDEVARGVSLSDTRDRDQAVMDRCMHLLALQGPLARDLRWAMAMIRIGKDYERVQSLARALFERVETLSNTLLDEILHAMCDVMRDVLKLHALVLDLWEEPAETAHVPSAAIEDRRGYVLRRLVAVEELAVGAMVQGKERAENLRELVLACRHLERIAGQLADIPTELTALNA